MSAIIAFGFRFVVASRFASRTRSPIPVVRCWESMTVTLSNDFAASHAFANPLLVFAVIVMWMM